jgi:hypothetical protein
MTWIPACAGMTGGAGRTGRRAGSDGAGARGYGGRGAYIVCHPGESRGPGRPRAGVTGRGWIPAYAGMTGGGAGMAWIPAYAGMTGGAGGTRRRAGSDGRGYAGMAGEGPTPSVTPAKATPCVTPAKATSSVTPAKAGVQAGPGLVSLGEAGFPLARE